MSTLNEDRITSFFSKITVTPEDCISKALSISTEPLTPIPLQGLNSYTLYATPAQDTIVQFRRASKFANLDVQKLAKQTYGDLVPNVSFEGELGDEDEEHGREPVCVYLMNRLPGVSWINFMLNLKVDDMEATELNNSFAAAMARFMARGWRSPQSITPNFRRDLKSEILNDLQILRQSLDGRFTPFIEACISSLDDILALPFAVQHQNLDSSNILVDPSTGRITGVLGWSEALVRPFGMGLHNVETLTTHLDTDPERLGFQNHNGGEKLFWETFRDEVCGLDSGVIAMINMARVLGILLDRGLVRNGAGERTVVDLDRFQERGGAWWLENLLIDGKTKLDY